jgi:hypothetical protein
VPPWGCWIPRNGVSKEDIGFWVARRGWKCAGSKGGRRIYGVELEEDVMYDIR